VEALEARGVPYLILSGREEEALEDLLDSLPSKQAAVIRIGALDRGAHQGAYKLAEMAERLRHLLETRLPALHGFCRRQKRELILTTDHGLSLTAEALSHGQGGVYEGAIFRARWSF
jgi:DNA-directed RNA polymerase specialized sigma24 family protein